MRGHTVVMNSIHLQLVNANKRKMKEMKTVTTTTADKPATFTTPHEQNKTEKVKESKPTAKAPKKEKKKDKVQELKPVVARDQFGGRLGTRMSKINMVVINAGKKGATIHEVAAKTKESTSI